MDKDVLDDNVSFQVIFSGKTIESDKENMFTISLMSLAIKSRNLPKSQIITDRRIKHQFN